MWVGLKVNVLCVLGKTLLYSHFVTTLFLSSSSICWQLTLGQPTTVKDGASSHTWTALLSTVPEQGVDACFTQPMWHFRPSLLMSWASSLLDNVRARFQSRAMTNPGVGAACVDSFWRIGRIPWGRIPFLAGSTPQYHSAYTKITKPMKKSHNLS